MAKVKCQECKKEIVGGAKIQEFDPVEPTSMHIFCSKTCRDKWASAAKA
ncbi:hypothetical protein LCGC14_0617370 [marine sediment metagenome]|uniref:Uncharacterized protein n=1 Tax=marine sediment metagenome TaxID=412755 RepID=A0A0F9TS67_9ZZZZ